MRRALVIAAALSLSLLAASPAQATVRTVGPGVPADCSTDVTASLQSWLNTTVADGDTVQLPSGACYRIDGTINLTDRHNLTIVGLAAGATLKMVSTPPATPKITHAMIDIVGGSGITFRNVTVQSTNPAAVFNVNREWYPLFSIEGASTVLLDDMDGRNAWGDFVQISPDQRNQTNGNGAGAVLANGVTVQNSRVDIVGRHAVSCTGCDNVTVNNDAFSDIGYHVVDIEVEGDVWHARNFHLTDNTISGTLHHSVLANAGIGTDVSGIDITGNVDTATHQTCTAPVWVLDTAPTKDDWVITGNQFKALGQGFSVEGMSHVTLDSNKVSFTNGGCSNAGAAVYETNMATTTVRSNDFTTATRIFQAGANLSGITACGNRLGADPNRPVPC